jgi:DNA-binding LytR/AlgR family response regulator
MKCLIVDDDKISRSSLEYLCTKIDGLEVVTTESAIKAMDVLNREEFDVIFLDVEMPEMTGLDLIRINKKLPPIIITSANTVYAFDAFELDVVDYLRKPLTLPRVMKAINKVMTTPPTKSSEGSVQKASDDVIFLKVDGKHVKLELSAIRLVESMRDYVIFKTEMERFIVHSTLKNIEDRLCGEGRFVKVHRSFIINTDHIEDLDDRSVIMGKHIVPVSRSNKQALMKHLNSF